MTTNLFWTKWNCAGCFYSHYAHLALHDKSRLQNRSTKFAKVMCSFGHWNLQRYESTMGTSLISSGFFSPFLILLIVTSSRSLRRPLLRRPEIKEPKNDAPRTLGNDPSPQRQILQRKDLSCGVKGQFFSNCFTITGFKTYHRLFFIYQESIFDASGFPVIMFSLRFTKSQPLMSKPSYLVPGDLLEILSLPWHLEVCAECSKVQGVSAN